MRRILIDSELEAKAIDYSTNLFTGRNVNFKTPLNELTKLRDSLQPMKHTVQKQYVQKIIDQYQEILKASPEEMRLLITSFQAIAKSDILESPLKTKDKLKFHELIVNAMRYDELRSSEFRRFVASSGIKTCVYCNSQLAIIAEVSFYDKKKKKRKPKVLAKFELDHYHSKSQYPFLCTSFYNLYPVCGNCNRAKSKIDIKFELYTYDAAKLDLFTFWIDDKTIIDYWLAKTPDISKLKIYFDSIDGDYDFINEYNKIFGIQGIYDTQSDVAEELLHKAKVYTNAYNKSLLENFHALFPDNNILKKLIIGNYANSSETFKRPMAKYTQDLAKQLGLI